MMDFAPFLSPDDAAGEDKRYTSEEVQQMLDSRLNEEKHRYESALQNESQARLQAENALREKEKQLKTHEMRLKAQSALRERQLPDQLIGILDLSSEGALAQTLSVSETAFRSALEEGVRSRLRGQAPGLTPLPQKNRKPRSLSYQEAAALYERDRRQNK